MVQFIISLIFSSFVWGQGMVSSGGRIFQDENNPWFISNNTSKIKYCVRVDQQSISASKSDIDSAIVESFQYWKQEVRKAGFSVNKLGSYDLYIDAQKVDDCRKSDIEFLFGHKTLNEERLKFLKEPQRYIGVTVRENYDQKNLKGRGFIYVSSDKGPKRYAKADNLVDQAWRYKKLLKYTIIHEIGHTLGIPHMGDEVMSETFLDSLLNVKLYKYFLAKDISTFVGNPKVIKICNASKASNIWLGLSFKNKCFKVEETINLLEWNVYDDTNTHVGTFTSSSVGNLNTKIQPIGFLWTNKDQTVFGTRDLRGKKFLLGPLRRHFNLDVAYKLKNSPITKKAFMIMGPNSLKVIGAKKNNTQVVFNYKSDLSFIMFAQE